MEEKTGIVTRRVKGFYYLKTDQGEVECKVKGALFKKSRFDNQIAVGDHVRFIKKSSSKVGLIVSIDPRKSFLSRRRVGADAEQVLAANVDYLLIVTAVKTPSPRFNFINRMLVAAAVGNIEPVLVITKTDLASRDHIEKIIEPYKALDIQIILFSALLPADNSELLNILSRNYSVLAGHSGVGKSSLLNKLFPSLSIKIKPVSHKTGKGSHTTTYAVMHQVAENGFVVDTPGIREFGFRGVSEDDLDQFYPSVKEFRHLCKHRNCRHMSEPGCAVKTAVENGEIHERLYRGYVSVYESLNSPHGDTRPPGKPKARRV